MELIWVLSLQLHQSRVRLERRLAGDVKPGAKSAFCTYCSGRIGLPSLDNMPNKSTVLAGLRVTASLKDAYFS